MTQQPTTCRFCLAEGGLGINLFDHYVSEKKLCLALVASQLFDLKIDKEDGISEDICAQCFLKTYECYDFKLKCQKSEFILKENHDERNVEVHQCSISIPNLSTQEIPQFVSDSKKNLSPGNSTRKRKVDVSGEEANILTKKLNSFDEAPNNNCQGIMGKAMECKSCLQCFHFPEIIDHILEHMTIEKSAELGENSLSMENMCREIDWIYEKANSTVVKTRLKCDPDLPIVKTEVSDGLENGYIAMNMDTNYAEPFDDGLDDIAVVYVGGSADGESKKYEVMKEKDVREMCSVERENSVNFEMRENKDGYSSEDGKSMLRKLLSAFSGSCAQKREDRIENALESCAEVQHKGANYNPLEFVDVKCESPVENNLLEFNTSNEFEINHVTDERDEDWIQSIPEIKPSCNKADLSIANSNECITNDECFINGENSVFGSDSSSIMKDIPPYSSNVEAERYELVRNQLQHSKNSLERKSGKEENNYTSSLDSLLSTNGIDHEERSSQQNIIHLHKKYSTLGTTVFFNNKKNRQREPKEQKKHVSLLGKSADKMNVIARKKEELHRRSSSVEGYGYERVLERQTKTPVSPSSMLSHLKTIVNSSSKNYSSQSLLTKWTDSSKKPSLTSNVLKNSFGLSDNSMSSFSKKEDRNMEKFDCWLCVQTFPTARSLLDHSYSHFEHSKKNNIHSSSPSDVLRNTKSDQKSLLSSDYSSTNSSPPKLRFSSVALANGMLERKLVESEKFLQKKLEINELNSKAKSFRCPACLKKFLEWSTIVQHIVQNHENLSKEWPTKILFLPQVKQNLGKSSLINVEEKDADPLILMQSLLCGMRCEFCRKPFHSERALYKHKIWAHPDNIGV